MATSWYQTRSENLALGGDGGLDRRADLRRESDVLARSDVSRFALIWQGKILVRDDAPEYLAWLAPDHPTLQGAELLFLGQTAEGPCFAAEIRDFQPDPADSAAIGGLFDQSRQPFPPCPGASFVDLRGVLTTLTPLDAEIAASARGVLEWHKTHGFCSACGARSRWEMGGWVRQCPDCGTTHYPRTDPVVIMLVTADDHVLMARSLGWPEGLWSIPAGFIEPGETISNAVRREIFEETAITVGAVQVLTSQPWPFPASLMIGCQARATRSEIRVDATEIDAAEWVSRTDMMALLDGRQDGRIPARQGAIARFLLEEWVSDRLPPL